MKLKEQRIAIAEACGWRFAETGPQGKWWAPPKGEKFVATLYERLPDYLNDLNAMHEAEKHLRSLYPRDEFHEFGYQLEEIMTRDEERVWHATAPQRAEAFLRTLGKWIE